MGSADADVVEASGDAQGDGAAVVDTVGTYSAVGVEAFAGVARWGSARWGRTLL